MSYALTIENVSKFFYKNENGSKKKTKKRSLKDIFLSLFTNKFNEKFIALNNVSININKGEIYGILGENGSGKSTLIRMISTLLLPDEGSIKIFGKDVVMDPKLVQKMINRVSVDASFFKKLSPKENLRYTARLYGMDIHFAEKKIKEILEELNFDTSRLDDSIDQFSRGMQQKVAIARAFLTSPVLLLLDEPTTGLDPRSKKDVQIFIRKIMKEHDTTVLLTTHDMQEAEELCDRLTILQKGDILVEGKTTELKRKHTKSGHGSLQEVFLSLTGKEYQKEDDTG